MAVAKVLDGRISHEKYETISYKKQKNNMTSIPQEMIYCILARLPADVLHNSIRYVCRQWYNIIQDPHFIKEQLLCSTAGLFIQHDSALHTPQFVELGNVKEATVTEIRLPCSKRVLDTCDGLPNEEEENRTVHVVNPLTKQRELFIGLVITMVYEYVIALDVESEILHEIPSPEVIGLGHRYIFYTGKGKSLCCMVRYFPGTILDVWVLSDPMSGVWRKLHQIDFDTVQRHVD
ncbi:hypothetical protein RHMOL_Rhmol12G0136800 [Rhododendron molle]|uniref:Uncharacterized protein n=1 Tax=Rhododendron molle TaxID=49168 RepID=A0ACC0LHS1_RHOML|nr:hypothetical protein RHMOL_Rhmol12G0136800 [Rhododendron molle]